MTVLKKSCYATWHSAIITTVTSLASSNFFSTQSDACVHPIILIVHVADQDFTDEIVIQNSKFRLAVQILSYRLFQCTQFHWKSLPSHPDSLEFSSNALSFIGILFQVTRLHWNSLPSHSASLEFSSNSSGFIFNSLPTHSVSLEISSNTLGFIGILF